MPRPDAIDPDTAAIDMIPYIEAELASGARGSPHITRHMLGLFHGRPGRPALAANPVGRRGRDPAPASRSIARRSPRSATRQRIGPAIRAADLAEAL